MAQQDSLGQQLIEAGLVSADQLKTAQEYQKSLGGRLAQIVVKLGFVSDHALTQWLAKKHNLPVVDLSALVLPVSLMKRVPWDLIRKHTVVPVQLQNKTMTIATSDPTDFDLIDELQFATGLQVEFNIAERAQILKAIKDFATHQVQHSEPKITSGSHGKLKPASQGTLSTVRAHGESELVDEMKTRSEGRIPTGSLNRGDLREALIPCLLKKGVITRLELYDAVLDLLVKKGVVEQGELKEILRMLQQS